MNDKDKRKDKAKELAFICCGNMDNICPVRSSEYVRHRFPRCPLRQFCPQVTPKDWLRVFDKKIKIGLFTDTVWNLLKH